MNSSVYSIKEIISLEDFQGLQKEWNEFLKKINQDSFFFRHEWFECCWRRLQKDYRVWMWLVRDNKEIIAIAPFMVRADRVRRLLVRRVMFLENADTPFVDFIAGRRRKEGIEAVFKQLIRYRNSWDVIFLDKIPEDSQSLSILEGISEARGYPSRSDKSSQRIFVKNTGDWEAYWRGKSQRFRKTMRNVINRFEKLGKVSIEHHRQPENLDKVLSDLFAISGKSWKNKIGMDMTSLESIQGFFRDLSIVLRKQGTLDIWLLKLDGKPVAMEYALIDQYKVWAIRADFDEGFKQFSPGTYLNYMILVNFFNTDFLEYDMGPGSNQYKLRWATEQHGMRDCKLYNKTIYGRGLFYLEHRIIPMIRFCKLELSRRFEKENKKSI